MTIGFIGAGNVASHLGTLLSKAGHQVLYGTKNPVNGQVSLGEAAQQSDVLFLAIPYTAKQEVIQALKDAMTGKIVVDLTNPLNEDWSPKVLGAENSSGEETGRLLPESNVVKAFNTIFADVMRTEKQQFHGHKLTAFICGNDADANQVVAQLAADAGFAPLVVGELKNARYVEAIAHLNIQLAVGMQGGTDAGFAYFQRQTAQS